MNTLVLDVQDGVAVVTLSRPERRNAFTGEMSEELARCFDSLTERPDVRAIVVTGDPRGKAFCAGADLGDGSSFAAGSGQMGSAANYRDTGGHVTLAILRCPKPIIAALNGAAVGIGATMALAMDLRIVAADAKVGFVFVRRGLTPEAVSSFLLPRVVGLTKAVAWCLTGQVFRARDEAGSGLFTEVLEDARDVLPRAMELARDMAANCAPVATALTKALLYKGLGGADASPEAAHLNESRCLHHCFTSGDTAEGALSFLQKRPPAFPGALPEDLPAHWPWWRPLSVSRL